jgi:RHS repeat-associated protein
MHHGPLSAKLNCAATLAALLFTTSAFALPGAMDIQRSSAGDFNGGGFTRITSGAKTLKALQNPNNVAVEIAVTNLRAASDEFMELYVGPIQRFYYKGAGKDESGEFVATNYPPRVVYLDLRQEWPLKILCTNSGTSDNSGTAELSFYVKPPPEYVIKKSAPPQQYFVVINGEVLDVGDHVTLEHPSGGNLSTNYSKIEVLTGKFGHSILSDDCNDPRPAPGEEKPLSLGPGRTPDTNRIAIDWSVALGRTFDGLAQGRLSIHETSLTSWTWSPHNLFYEASTTNIAGQIELLVTNFPIATTNARGATITNDDHVLRQVKAYQTFVDILTPDTNQMVLKFYVPSQVATNQDTNGYYTNFTSAPFVTWIIANPNPSSTNNLTVTEARNNGHTYTTTLSRTANGNAWTWTLTKGSGSATIVETRGIGFLGSPATDRFETNIIQYANSSSPAYKCIEKYHFYPWDSELKEMRIPGTPDLVTAYEYYDDTNAPYGAWGYGQLRQVIYPDGYWEKRAYEEIPNSPTTTSYKNIGSHYGGYGNGLLRYVFHPYLDGRNDGATSPNNATPGNSISETYDYDSPSMGVGFPLGRSCTKWDAPRGIFVVGNEFAYTDDWDDCPEGPAVLSVSAETGAIPPEESPGASGNTTELWDYSDAAAPGLAGHPWWPRRGGTREEKHYYDHGTYDAQSAQFTLDPSNHIYDWNNLSNRYPDHRETILRTYCPGGTGHVTLRYPQVDDVDYLEDHWVFKEELRGLQRNLSRKETRVYHAGNLALNEDYLYLGLLNNDPDSPEWALLSKTKNQTDSLGRVTNSVRIDGTAGGQLRTLYTADYRGTSGFDGELLLSETDEFGVKKSYTYDTLKRIASITIKGYGSQPDTLVQYLYDAQGRTIAVTNTSGSLSQVERWAFDHGGRLTNHVDKSGLAVNTTISADGQTFTDTYPGGVTVIRKMFPDRRQKSLEGTGVVSQFYDYYAADLLDEDSEFDRPEDSITKTLYGHDSSPRWRIAGKSNFGYDVWQQWPLGSGTTNTGWVRTWRDESTAQPQMVDRSGGLKSDYFVYDFAGNQWCKETGDDWGASRTIVTEELCTQIDGRWYLATTNYLMLADGSDALTFNSATLQQLSGFQGSETDRTIQYDADTNETITTTYLTRTNNFIKQEVSKPATSCLGAISVLQNGLLISNTTLSVSAPFRYFYDSLGRTNQVQDPLGNSTFLTYDPVTGWLTSIQDPLSHTTSFQYYGTNEANAGKVKCQINAAGKRTYYAYTTQGQIYRTWGDVPYPAEYHYSEYGDLTNLITFRSGSGWTASTWPASPGTGDNTYWNYDEASGLLLQKLDDQKRATIYNYSTVTGQLLTRSLARLGTNGFPVTVTNIYNTFGDLTEQDYNDATPNVTLGNYNRAGLPRLVIDGSGTNTLAYDHANRLITTRCDHGPLAGITVSNHFDARYGRDGLSVLNEAGPLVQHSFGYDSFGRLGSVSSGVYSAEYGYLPNSDLLQTTTCKNNGATVLTTTRSWEYGMRLAAIINQVGGTVVSSFGYEYDGLNRRTECDLEDGSYWRYTYNDRDELTGAKRYWSDRSPVAGQLFAYDYDNIGNRKTADSGGDVNGTNLREISYTANSLNQYTAKTTPGYKDILGAALATDTVTVNSGATARKVEYFHREIGIDNSSGPVWQNVSVSSGGCSSNGGFIFPKYQQTLTYDADGNLSFDGVWNYEWDAENRLKSMTMTNVANIANSNRLRLEFRYDSQNRRSAKTVKKWDGLNFTNQVLTSFAYDGWNLLAELPTPGSALRTYMWGQDLSGTLIDAGGVGGLLAVWDSSTLNNQSSEHFVTYDGNGNASDLVNSADSTLSAKYQFSPYGELERSTGPMAQANPFRWSTKFGDDQTGLIYYGYRYYGPSLGKWTSRDPAEEAGTLNLYAALGNSPITEIDSDGQILFGKDKFAALVAVIATIGTSSPNSPRIGPLKEWNIKAQALEDAQAEGARRGIAPKSAPPSGGGKPPSSQSHVRMVQGLSWMFIAVGLEATYRSAFAAASVAYGIRSAPGTTQYAVESSFINAARGETAYADLDAIEAAISMTGGAGAAATEAWGTFAEADGIFAEVAPTLPGSR